MYVSIRVIFLTAVSKFQVREQKLLQHVIIRLRSLRHLLCMFLTLAQSLLTPLLGTMCRSTQGCNRR